MPEAPEAKKRKRAVPLTQASKEEIRRRPRAWRWKVFEEMMTERFDYDRRATLDRMGISYSTFKSWRTKEEFREIEKRILEKRLERLDDVVWQLAEGSHETCAGKPSLQAIVHIQKARDAAYQPKQKEAPVDAMTAMFGAALAAAKNSGAKQIEQGAIDVTPEEDD